MRNKIALLLAVLMLASALLCGCGEEKTLGSIRLTVGFTLFAAFIVNVPIMRASIKIRFIIRQLVMCLQKYKIFSTFQCIFPTKISQKKEVENLTS